MRRDRSTRWDTDANPEPGLVGRRKLLKALGIAAVTRILGGCGDASSPGPETRGRVLIVGGGLGGLAALDALVAAGWEASLLEGAQRLGGRILTLRSEMPEGLHAEAGAERIRKNHVRLAALLRRHRISTIPYERGPLAWRQGEARHVFSNRSEIPQEALVGLSAVEMEGAPLAVHLELASAAPVPGRGQSAWEWLRSAGMTTAGAELVRAFSPWPLDMPASTFRELALVERAYARETETVPGGLDRIIQAVAEPHESRIRLGIRIVDVRQDANRVVLKDQLGAEHVADRALFCIPHRPLAALSFAAGRPAELARRLEELAVEDEIKVHLVTPPGLLGGDDQVAYNLASSFPRVTWLTPGLPQGRGHVVNMMALRDDVAPVRAAILAGPEALRAQVAATLPTLARSARAVVAHDYGGDLLAGGAYTWRRSGDPPDGRVVEAGRCLFAGSDLSDSPGWMEGALESADAAVQRLLA